VTRVFVEGFDGKNVIIACIYFSVMEETIIEKRWFPIESERWFKNRTLIGIDIEFFLKDEHRGEDWRKNV